MSTYIADFFGPKSVRLRKALLRCTVKRSGSLLERWSSGQPDEHVSRSCAIQLSADADISLAWHEQRCGTKLTADCLPGFADG